MESTQALTIVTALADGVDPRTGAILDRDSLFQDSLITRALFLAVQALTKQVENDNRKKVLPGNVGKSWTVDEETRLVGQFDAGQSINQLAKDLGRTIGAIRARLAKLGKIDYEAPSFTRYNRV